MIVSRYLRINSDNSIIKFGKRKRLKKSGTTGVRKYQRYCLLKLYHSETRCTRGKQCISSTAKTKRSILFMRRRQETTEMLKESMGDALLSLMKEKPLENAHAPSL